MYVLLLIKMLVIDDREDCAYTQYITVSKSEHYKIKTRPTVYSISYQSFRYLYIPTRSITPTLLSSVQINAPIDYMYYKKCS